MGKGDVHLRGGRWKEEGGSVSARKKESRRREGEDETDLGLSELDKEPVHHLFRCLFVALGLEVGAALERGVGVEVDVLDEAERKRQGVRVIESRPGKMRGDSRSTRTY